MQSGNPLLLRTNPNTNSRIIETLRIFGDFNLKGISIHGEYAYIIMEKCYTNSLQFDYRRKTKTPLNEH